MQIHVHMLCSSTCATFPVALSSQAGFKAWNWSWLWFISVSEVRLTFHSVCPSTLLSALSCCPPPLLLFILLDSCICFVLSGVVGYLSSHCSAHSVEVMQRDSAAGNMLRWAHQSDHSLWLCVSCFPPRLMAFLKKLCVCLSPTSLSTLWSFHIPWVRGDCCNNMTFECHVLWHQKTTVPCSWTWHQSNSMCDTQYCYLELVHSGLTV